MNEKAFISKWEAQATLINCPTGSPSHQATSQKRFTPFYLYVFPIFVPLMSSSCLPLVCLGCSYDPKAARQEKKGAETFLISPLTGERIPASQYAEHMRISLLVPDQAARSKK